MGFSTTEVNKLTFKVQAGGVIDADSGSRWYEARLAFSPKVLPSRILTNYNLIPTANVLSDAVTNAAADPTNIEDLSAATSAVRLSRVTSGADNTWIAYNTLDTPSSGVKQNWIAPPSVPQASGAGSGGYGIILWSGDPNGAAGTFNQIFTSAEQDNNPGYVGWVWNYDMGVLFLANDLVSAISSNAGGNYSGGFELYVTGFRYVGTTGGGSGSAGATGAQGASGSQGAIGLQGATGEGGTIGSTGSQGSIGLQGATGEGGVIGSTGSQGAAGEQGAVGLQGATGEGGTIGSTGSQGAAGEQGAVGLQGAT